MLIGPKFKNEFQIPAAADTMSLNLKPCKFTTFCWKRTFEKGCRPHMYGYSYSGHEDKSGYISNLQETEILQIHVRIWVSSYCVKRLEMAGKFHCVTHKKSQISSPTNPEVWYSSSCAFTVKKITEIAWKVSKTKENKRLFEAAWEALFEAAALFPPNRKSLFHLALTRCRGWNRTYKTDL